jgi:hypothetical protein
MLGSASFVPPGKTAAFRYIGAMTKEQVKEILNRVLTWPQKDQERVASFARQLEQMRGDDITDEEWQIIEEACRPTRSGERRRC